MVPMVDDGVIVKTESKFYCPFFVETTLHRLTVHSTTYSTIPSHLARETWQARISISQYKKT